MDSPSYSFILQSSSDDEISDMEQEAVSIASIALTKLRAKRSDTPIQRRARVERDRFEANKRLLRDYFDPSPRYKEETFRRRFRMSKRLFLRIAHDLEERFSYFRQRINVTGNLGFTSIQKCTSALRVLGYGFTIDINDDYLKMGEKTSRDTLENFTIGIKDLYEERYLRKPTSSDLMRLYDVHQEVHGLPGMLGSIDCMHWEWENCPTAWRGQHHRSDQKNPTLILQAVASYDLWIWSAYFGVPGSNNDINVLEQSPVLEDFIAGKNPTLRFYANDNFHPHGYYLGDEIYPEYSFLVKTFTDPSDPKRINFKQAQESARKDIERAFGILKKRFHFVRNPCRLWTKDKIKDTMRCCLILHNMILEDDGNAYCQDYQPEEIGLPMPALSHAEAIQNSIYMRSHTNHYALMQDLIEEAWINRNVTNNEENNNNNNNNNNE